MLKRFLIAAAFILAACQSAAPIETSLVPPTISVSPTPPPKWLETEMNGVSLGMWQPDGWESDLTDGMVVAEHTAVSGGSGAGGLLIYLFVPPPGEFHIKGNPPNYALAMLDQVVKMPSHMGWDMRVTQPIGFQWGEQQAAYYLMTKGDGTRALIIALAPPNLFKVVLCNVSAPLPEASRIRALLPQLLDGLTVNGKSLHGSALDDLPNPLPFPRYSQPPTDESESGTEESDVTSQPS